jgi:hypothetical protein
MDSALDGSWAQKQNSKFFLKSKNKSKWHGAAETSPTK